MLVVTTATELESHAGGILVPTMGALHDGHQALVRRARMIADTRDHVVGGNVREAAEPRVVVSIFVNPTQFGPNEDYARYPRTLEADLRGCEACGADVVFAPPVDVVYPPEAPPRTPALPSVATEPRLEDAARPTHFAGVCRVVLRLFDLCKPSAAVFGEKDWQQLQVVRAMVRMERLGIQIVAGETVREDDGLAMSSRNRFLSADDRVRALAISDSLRLARGVSHPDEAEGVMVRRLREAGITPDYAVVRDAETLAPRRRGEWDESRVMRAVVAGRVGSVRLLDNAVWGGAWGPRG